MIATNSGISGPGSVLAVDLTATGVTKDFADVTSADLSGLSQNDWMADDYDLVIDSYYNYNPQTHVLTPTNLVYAMMDAEGKFLKFQITGFYGGGAPPAMANFIIKYVYAASGTDLSGTPVVDTVDGSSGMFYYDFSAGRTTTPADSATSLEWDILISNYNVYLNSSLTGSGQAAGNPLSLFPGVTDPTDFDAYTTAETQPQAYFEDEQSSAFLNRYDLPGPPDHFLTSKNHVYVVNVDRTYYKLMIETYNGDTGASGNPIFWWAEL